MLKNQKKVNLLLIKRKSKLKNYYYLSKVKNMKRLQKTYIQLRKLKMMGLKDSGWAIPTRDLAKLLTID